MKKSYLLLVGLLCVGVATSCTQNFAVPETTAPVEEKPDTVLLKDAQDNVVVTVSVYNTYSLQKLNTTKFSYAKTSWAAGDIKGGDNISSINNPDAVSLGKKDGVTFKLVEYRTVGSNVITPANN